MTPRKQTFKQNIVDFFTLHFSDIIPNETNF